MITDNERREVAARLRANHRRDRETQGTFIARMVKGSDTVTASYVCRLPERLADLIDRPTTTRHGKFKTKYGRETPCCEVCGYSIGDMRWNHCPKCGAAIVDDKRLKLAEKED